MSCEPRHGGGPTSDTEGDRCEEKQQGAEPDTNLMTSFNGLTIGSLALLVVQPQLSVIRDYENVIAVTNRPAENHTSGRTIFG
jgi:hypothetical protein